MEVTALATTAVAFLSPYLVKAGEKATEKIGEMLPATAGNVWKAIFGKFKGNAAAEGAVKDLVARPDDQLTQMAFASQLRNALEAEPTFAEQLETLLATAKGQTGDTIINTGPGAVATRGGVAAGAGGVAIGGDVRGNVSANTPEKKE